MTSQWLGFTPAGVRGRITAIGTILAGLAAALSFQGPLSAAEGPAEKPVFIGPAAPEELKVLAPLVGKWKTEVTARPSLVHKEGFTAKGEISGQWLHNGHYLRMESYSVSPRGRFEATEIIGYDRNAKKFRRFAFSTEGIMAESVGEWDAATQTMTWKAVNLPAGWTALVKTVVKKDQMVFTLLVKNDRGEVVRDVTSTAQRK